MLLIVLMPSSSSENVSSLVPGRSVPVKPNPVPPAGVVCFSISIVPRWRLLKVQVTVSPAAMRKVAVSAETVESPSSQLIEVRSQFALASSATV